MVREYMIEYIKEKLDKADYREIEMIYGLVRGLMEENR